MSPLHKIFASAAIGLGLALTATVASAVNPIINGNFKLLSNPDDYRTVVGWTSNMYKPASNYLAPTEVLFTRDVYDYQPIPMRPFTNFGRFDCAYNCPKGYTSSISQMVTGLEQNKTYTISFYIQGWAWIESYGFGRIYPPIPPFVVSLGSQSSTILLPAVTIVDDGMQTPWFKKSVSFTHTDPGSTALLTFTQNFSGQLYKRGQELQPGDIYHTYDWVFLSLVGDGITEEAPQGPSLSVQKALGGNRAKDSDQFTVQILNGSTVVNSATNSTTAGTGSSVTSGSGTTGTTTLTAGSSYTIQEVASGSTQLGAYNSTLACTNSGGSTVPTALGTAFTLAATDKVSCTLSNTPKPATLSLRQVIVPPVPATVAVPYTLRYTGTNGWAQEDVANPTQNAFVSSSTQTLSSFNTATTLTATAPDPRYVFNGFSCVDSKAAVTGNPTGKLVDLKAREITIAADNVRPGAAFLCTMLLGHLTP